MRIKGLDILGLSYCTVWQYIFILYRESDAVYVYPYDSQRILQTLPKSGWGRYLAPESHLIHLPSKFFDQNDSGYKLRYFG